MGTFALRAASWVEGLLSAVAADGIPWSTGRHDWNGSWDSDILPMRCCFLRFSAVFFDPIIFFAILGDVALASAPLPSDSSQAPYLRAPEKLAASTVERRAPEAKLVVRPAKLDEKASPSEIRLREIEKEAQQSRAFIETSVNESNLFFDRSAADSIKWFERTAEADKKWFRQNAEKDRAYYKKVAEENRAFVRKQALEALAYANTPETKAGILDAERNSLAATDESERASIGNVNSSEQASLANVEAWRREGIAQQNAWRKEGIASQNEWAREAKARQSTWEKNEIERVKRGQMASIAPTFSRTPPAVEQQPSARPPTNDSAAQSKRALDPAAQTLSAESRIRVASSVLADSPDSSVKQAGLRELDAARRALAQGKTAEYERHLVAAHEFAVLAGNIAVDSAKWAKVDFGLHRDPYFYAKDLPRYGNWGGKGYVGGRDGAQSPINDMDAAFMGHDEAYASANSMSTELLRLIATKDADEKLVRDLRAIRPEALKNQQLYRTEFSDRLYRDAAILTFTIKARLEDGKIQEIRCSEIRRGTGGTLAVSC